VEGRRQRRRTAGRGETDLRCHPQDRIQRSWPAGQLRFSIRAIGSAGPGGSATITTSVSVACASVTANARVTCPWRAARCFRNSKTVRPSRRRKQVTSERWTRSAAAAVIGCDGGRGSGAGADTESTPSSKRDTEIWQHRTPREGNAPRPHRTPRRPSGCGSLAAHQHRLLAASPSNLWTPRPTGHRARGGSHKAPRGALFGTTPLGACLTGCSGATVASAHRKSVTGESRIPVPEPIRSPPSECQRRP